MDDSGNKSRGGWVRQAVYELRWHVKVQPAKARHALRWRIQHARGLSGQFDHAEDSDRARLLSERWDRHWLGRTPDWGPLSAAFPERWVRFHSLPEAKRYADSPQEHQEINRRHRTVITELLQAAPLESLVAIAVDWPARDYSSGSSKRILVEPWPWRVFQEDRGADEEPNLTYAWVTHLSPHDLDTLISASAEEDLHPVIATLELDWLYCLYPGGANAFLPTAMERDRLRDRHREWLPSR